MFLNEKKPGKPSKPLNVPKVSQNAFQMVFLHKKSQNAALIPFF